MPPRCSGSPIASAAWKRARTPTCSSRTAIRSKRGRRSRVWSSRGATSASTTSTSRSTRSTWRASSAAPYAEPTAGRPRKTRITRERGSAMKAHIRFGACVLAAALAFGLAARADAPRTYAVTGARLVTVSGATIPSGTIVMKNGLIEAVGAAVQPPADAVVVDGAGMTVYPGLIDMGNPAGTDIQLNLAQSQQGSRTTDDAERAKRAVILRPQILAADHVKLDAPELSRLAAGG